MMTIALPVIFVCGEAGSGKSTVSDALVEKHGYVLVDGDLVHHYPPWNNYGIMEDLCCKFIQETEFMQATVDTIVKEIISQLRRIEMERQHNNSSLSGIVVPFVLYTQESRKYMAQCLASHSHLVSMVNFIWLELDQSIHKKRNDARVEKWAAVGIRMNPNDVVTMTSELCKYDSKSDCLVIENNFKDQIDSTVDRIHSLVGNMRTQRKNSSKSFLSRSPNVILLICSLTFGVYYAYDVPAALPDQFKKLSGGHTTSYELLYTVYSIPSIVAPLLIGILADSKFGPHLCSTLLSIMVFIACIIVALGCSLDSFGLVLVGRFLMGFGGETLYALQQTLSTWWVATDLQPLCMSLAIASGAIGEIANFIFTPIMYKQFQFCGTQWLVVVISSVSVLGALVLQFLSRFKHEVYEKKNDVAVEPSLSSHRSQRTSSHTPYVNFETRHDDIADDTAYIQIKGENEKVKIEKNEDWFDRWRGIVQKETVLLYSINVLSMSAYYILPSIIKQFLKEVHHPHHVGSTNTALSVLLYLIPLLLSPLLGWLVGDFQLLHLLYGLTFGCLNAAIGFMMFAYHHHMTSSTTFNSPIVSIAVLGFGCSIITCTLTPCIALSVKTELHGSAFGLWSCMQSAGIALYSVVIGLLSDNYSTQAAVIFLGTCASFSVLFCSVLIMYTKRYANPPSNADGLSPKNDDNETTTQSLLVPSNHPVAPV